MGNLLSWLEIGLAQIILNYLNIYFLFCIGQGNLSDLKVIDGNLSQPSL